MSLSIGIVGLPNVGKSTLFKVLTKKKVDISNYPFCTIEPNIGIVSVPDERLEKLVAIFNSKKIVPAVIKFVDIAGIVRGANKGEGLGNQFLSHIREADAIIHLARAFESGEIVHTENNIDPGRDIEIINTELILKDLETAAKRLAGLEKDVRAGKKEAVIEREILTEIIKTLDKGGLVSQYLGDIKEKPFYKAGLLTVQQLQFLTAKPVIYVFNSDNEISDAVSMFMKNSALEKPAYLALNIKEETEISEFSEEEKRDLGIKESALSDLIKKSYELLNLITFFTTGEDETRAWTIQAGTKAPQAAGVIHSDFENKFIKAEVVECDKLLAAGGFSQAGAKGWLRVEGKDYIIQDGDVITVKHG